ncbi:MAG: FAD-dependent oxidoreductase [Chlorobiaceae bacterium]|nr:FAD-dependent oxidoreductase [Chlorobiaceae bacterium]NTV60164.1 FAD-dependent oxidoreductase [Chlorobiaceae bacterium]
MNPLSLIINGKAVLAAPGSSILDAAAGTGISIPTLCFHESLGLTGSCWMCIVEIKGKNRFVPACSTKVSEGMIIETENEELDAMRRQNLDRIIARHCGDCLGPCERSCPAGCDIPDFIAAIARGDDREALRIIRETIPLPGILGRICPAPCEDECRRQGMDKPVSICALKRYAADSDMLRPVRLLPEIAPETGKKIAVVGSGPAGLAAAYYLRCFGHGVMIFESDRKAGGMMRYGIPRFRLSEAVIDEEVGWLADMGIEFRFGTTFGKDVTARKLKERFHALFLAVGAQKASPMNIPGEEITGVLSGIEFLRLAASGKGPETLGQVVVAGGGNTAVDAARTALRLGAESVTILYRRSAKDMPANRREIEEALAEGIILIEHAAPTAVRRSGDILEITTVRMEPGEPDSTGRRAPVPVPGSEFTIPAGTLIAAIGQEIDPAAGNAAGIGTKRGGALRADPETLQTEIPWIFAGGDCVTGTDIAIRALEQGKRAARSIDLYVSGKPVCAQAPVFNSSYGSPHQTPRELYRTANSTDRVPVPELSPAERIGGFAEVSSGYTGELAAQEALRCLACRCSAVETCRLRDLASVYHNSTGHGLPEHEVFCRVSAEKISMEREKCVDCGICVRLMEQCAAEGPVDYAALSASCPTGALAEPCAGS